VAFVMGGRIAVATPQSGALQVLTLGVDRRDASPSFSPDGQSLAIVSRRVGEANADIQLLSLAGAPGDEPRAEAPRRALTATAGLDESEPCFSPDGSFVVFVREDNLVRLQLADGRQTRLTGGFRKVRHPRFLPSGRLLCVWTAEKQYGLDVMDADGKNRETLSTGSAAYGTLAPSPDARFLLATFEFDLRFHWRDVLKLRATRELRLLDARGAALGVVARSPRHSYHSGQWGP
jgi:Tol biopolymer transport system component